MLSTARIAGVTLLGESALWPDWTGAHGRLLSKVTQNDRIPTLERPSRTGNLKYSANNSVLRFVLVCFRRLGPYRRLIALFPPVIERSPAPRAVFPLRALLLFSSLIIPVMLLRNSAATSRFFLVPLFCFLMVSFYCVRQETPCCHPFCSPLPRHRPRIARLRSQTNRVIFLFPYADKPYHFKVLSLLV